MAKTILQSLTWSTASAEGRMSWPQLDGIAWSGIVLEIWSLSLEIGRRSKAVIWLLEVIARTILGRSLTISGLEGNKILDERIRSE